MTRAFAVGFYQSDEWLKCRESYLTKVGGLCEICLQNGIYTPAVIVHHKIHLNAENIKDPTIALSFDNLCAVCRDCHGKVHRPDRRYKIATNGAVITN